MPDSQIKNRKRVKDYGEVFTKPETVSDMVDLIGKAEPDADAYRILTRLWLEPACGTGNFLTEILSRKLAICETPLDACIAVSTIYGVDIQEDNVHETQERLAGMVYDRFGRSPKTELVISYFLHRNIVAGNTLTGLTNDGEPIWFLQEEEEQMSLFPGGAT